MLPVEELLKPLPEAIVIAPDASAKESPVMMDTGPLESREEPDKTFTGPE